MQNYKQPGAWALALALMSAGQLTHADDGVSLSGFVNIAGGFVDNPGTNITYGGYREKEIMFENSMLGIQISKPVSDSVTATVQMTSRGTNDFDVEIEWAYLSWQATDNSKLRVGRLRMPLYLFSDYLDVGYSYPWITPPAEVYYLPFNNINGLDYYLTRSLGQFDTSFQAYYGSYSEEFIPVGGTSLAKANSRDQTGVVFTLGQDWWTLRTAFHRATSSVDLSALPLGNTTLGGFTNSLRQLGYGVNADNLIVFEDTFEFFQIGINLEKNNFLLTAEHVEFETDISVFSKDVREYLMLGYRYDDYLFHITKSRSKDERNHPEAGIAPGRPLPVVGSSNVLIGTINAIAMAQLEQRDTMTYGVRWDVGDGVALKLQYQTFEERGRGLKAPEEQNVYSFAVQSVF
jgi:hypothetical protein